MIVADGGVSLVLTGTGDVLILEPALASRASAPAAIAPSGRSAHWPTAR